MLKISVFYLTHSDRQRKNDPVIKKISDTGHCGCRPATSNTEIAGKKFTILPVAFTCCEVVGEDNGHGIKLIL